MRGSLFLRFFFFFERERERERGERERESVCRCVRKRESKREGRERRSFDFLTPVPSVKKTIGETKGTHGRKRKKVDHKTVEEIIIK